MMLGEEGGMNNDGDEIAEAREILSWRPGFQPSSLPSKGGQKFFGRTDAVLEQNKVDTQLKQYQSVLRSQKVRKQSNLGQAEWLPDLGVAKITKQAKFIQHMGFHDGEIFALAAEEALFLLDIGDLELNFNDVPVSFQEALTLILSNEKSTCSFDEYLVFANLVKRGYIVQRFHADNRNIKPSKRKLSQDVGPHSSKELKSDDSQGAPHEEGQEMTSRGLAEENARCTTKVVRESQRGWFQEKNLALQHISSGPQKHHPQYAAFPNLADPSCTFLCAPQDLIPLHTQGNEFYIDKIWFQRINRDFKNDHQSPLRPFSHRVDFDDIERKARDWSHYKEMVEAAKHKNDRKLRKMAHKMQSGKIRPLLKPSDATTLSNVQKNIKTVKEIHSSTETKTLPPGNFAINYNVYQSGSTPFKKTNPGAPHCRVIVTKAENDPPGPEAILSLIQLSNGVPLKFAVVDCGQISYYELGEANVPSILCDG